MKPVFDSCILIDFLKRLPAARKEIERYAGGYVSAVTASELWSACDDAEEEKDVAGFLAHFDVLPFDTGVARKAARLSREHDITLPSAVLWATAQLQGTMLITRDAEAYPAGDPAIRIPYRL